jgi:hypothetical protein
MIHRVRRGDLTRIDNNAEVDRYAAILERLFRSWLGSGRHVAYLGVQMQDAAINEFAKGYLRGKRQSMPNSQLEQDDRQHIADLLASNQHFVQFSLEAAIEARRQVARITGQDESTVLDASFGARIRLQYGGRLWQVIEAGYLAGVREMAQRLQAHVGRPALVQARGVIANPDTGEEVSWDQADKDLADALGVTITELLDLAGLLGGSPAQGVRSGTAYITEDDNACDPCKDDANGGEDGIYWLPDEPPLPGEDCEGSQNCRCRLESVWDDGG